MRCFCMVGAALVRVLVMLDGGLISSRLLCVACVPEVDVLSGLAGGDSTSYQKEVMYFPETRAHG